MTLETFAECCSLHFGTLSARFGLALVSQREMHGRFSVAWLNTTTAVEVIWEVRERYAQVNLQARSDLDGCNLDWLISLRVPELMPPQRPYEEREARLDETLEAYASALEEVGSDVLIGDLDAISEVVKSRNVPWVLEPFGGVWAHLFPREVQAGDIFACRPRGGRYVYGRLIVNDAAVSTFDRLCLVYIYRASSASLRRVPQLCRDELLIPPFLTGQLDPTYFRPVKKRSLTDNDRLTQHCFLDSKGVLHDEHNHLLTQATGQCGVYGALTSADINRILAGAL